MKSFINSSFFRVPMFFLCYMIIQSIVLLMIQGFLLLFGFNIIMYAIDHNWLFIALAIFCAIPSSVISILFIATAFDDTSLTEQEAIIDNSVVDKYDKEKMYSVVYLCVSEFLNRARKKGQHVFTNKEVREYFDKLL